MRKLKYVTPTSDIMEFDPGCILAGSSDPGGWSVDKSGSGSTNDTGASSGAWGIDDSGTGSSSGTGASTGGWSNE